MAEKDTTEKILEAYNDVFADIVNVFFFDGRQVVDESELVDAQNFSSYKMDGKVKSQERDVSKFWKKGNIKIAFLGIENQSRIDDFMPLRIMGYDGAAYRSQLNEKNVKIEDLYPVVTFVLYFGTERWNRHKSLFDCINIPDELKGFVNDYKVKICEVSYLNDEQINMFRSDFKAVADFFVKRASGKRWEGTQDDLVHIREVLDLLSSVTSDDVYKNVKFPKIGTTGGVKMCDVAKRLKDEGREEVLKEIKSGKCDVAKQLKDEGREEAKNEERKKTLENVKQLLKIGNSIESIKDIFNLTEEELKIVTDEK